MRGSLNLSRVEVGALVVLVDVGEGDWVVVAPVSLAADGVEVCGVLLWWWWWCMRDA